MAMNLIKKENPFRMSRNEKIYFRDTGLYIHSSADGKITIASDGTGADDITLDGAVTITGAIQINGDLTFGDAVTDSLAVNGLYKQGTSGTPLVLTAGTPLSTLYSTCSSTSGSTSAEPLYMKSTMTGAGGVGGRARFHTYTNVALGGWVNALKGYMEFGASGSSSGLGSAIVGETVLSAGTSSGTYCALEGELVLGSGASTGTATSFIYLNATGADASTFDTNGYLLEIGTGITPAAGKFVSLTSHTLKCKIEANTRYAVFSQMEDGLGLGNSTTAMSLGTSLTQRAIDVYTTSASTDAGTSVRPIYMKSTMTGVGGVGGRAEFYMTTNVALGGWSNALKGFAEYGASGRTTGLGSAIVAELSLSAGTTSGNYAPLEVELNVPSGASLGTATTMEYLSVQGDDVATFRTSGYILNLQGLGTATTGKVFQENTALAATHALRILIGSTPYYVMLTSAGA